MDITLVVGRFQPFTNGHLDLLKKAQNIDKNASVVVCIVKGKFTSQDKDKNPFSFDIQKKMIEKSTNIPIDILEVPSGFIGHIIKFLREKNYEPKYWVAGEDRFDSFKSQIDKMKNELDLNIKMIKTNRIDDVSGTQVRDLLKRKDFIAFQKMVPKGTFQMKDDLLKFLENKINEDVDLDRKFRDEANFVFQKMQQRVNKSNFSEKEVQLQKEKIFTAFFFPMEFIDLKYKDIALALKLKSSKDKSTTGMIGSSKSYKILIILNQLTDEQFEKMLNSLIQYNKFPFEIYLDKITFVHEFIHVLDNHRTQGKNKKPGQFSTILSKGIDDTYYNNPSEFNAFYQETISYFEEILNLIKKDNNFKKRFSFKTFDDFFKHILDLKSVKNFYFHFDDKYKKKFQKRLFQYYKSLDKDLIEMNKNKLNEVNPDMINALENKIAELENKIAELEKLFKKTQDKKLEKKIDDIFIQIERLTMSLERAVADKRQNENTLIEIKHIFDFSKKGQEFVNNLLNNYVIINQKLDGSNFNIYKNKNGVVEYSGRGNKKIPITKRATSKLYENIIDYFEKKRNETDNFNFLNNDTLIEGEYFPQGLKPLVPIKIYPKNSWIPFQITQGGKINKDKSFIDKISEMLDVETPPVIFEGFLNSTQKKEIMDFIMVDNETRLARFKTQNFSQFILDLLNPQYKIKINDKILEGIVFYFLSDDQKPTILKMVDPMFTQMIKQKQENATDEKKNAYFQMIKKVVLDFMENHFTELKDRAVLFSNQNDLEQSFLDLINDVMSNNIEYFKQFKNIFQSYEEYIKSIDLGDLFDLNPKYVTPEIIKASSQLFYIRDVYKMILGHFLNPKRRSAGIFNKVDVDRINTIINGIQYKLITKENKMLFNTQKLLKLINN